MHFFRVVTALVTLLAFTGCTTMRMLEERSPASIQQNVDRGDRVRVAAGDGRVYELTVTKVEADSLTGRADNGKLYKIRYSGIQALEVREADLIGTVGAGLGTAVVIAGIALVVALHNLDIHFDICE